MVRFEMLGVQFTPAENDGMLYCTAIGKLATVLPDAAASLNMAYCPMPLVPELVTPVQVESWLTTDCAVFGETSVRLHWLLVP